MSPPSNTHLPSTQVPSHLHQVASVCILPESRSRLSHPHPSLIITFHLKPSHISIQVPLFSTQLHPGRVSPQPVHENRIPFPSFVFHLHPYHVWHPSRSHYSHLFSIQVASHFHPGHQNCISAPCRSHLTPIPIPRYAFPQWACRLVFRTSAGGQHIWGRVPDVFNIWLNVWNCNSKYFKGQLNTSSKR